MPEKRTATGSGGTAPGKRSEAAGLDASSPTAGAQTPPASAAADHAALIARLHRIEGQVRGIARMLQEDRTCEDIVTQLMAVRSSIDTAGAAVLDAHLATCIQEQDPQAQVTALRDAMRLWWKFAPAAGGAGATPSEVGASSPLPL